MNIFLLSLLLLLTGLGWAQPAAEETPPPPEESEHSPEGSRTGRFRLGGEGFGIGTLTPDPTALEGPNRAETVLIKSSRYGGTGPTVHYMHRFSDDQRVLLELDGGFDALGGDLSFSFNRNLTANIFGVTARDPAYEHGRPKVRLPNGEPMLVRRYGGGLEYGDELSEKFQFAVAANYQKVDVGDGLLGGLNAFDALGNPLTFAPNGSDELVTLNLVGQYNDLDYLVNPTDGTRLRFQLEQAVPVGDSQIAATMAAGNLAHLIPAPGFGDKASYVLLNFQGGVIGGDVPPYRAFNLGGSNSVRGYQLGGLATGSAFVQTTAEYRGSLTDFDLFGHEFDVKGVLFFDFGSDLDSADNVRGNPAGARNKRGHGIGYGLGVYLFSDLGLFRFETGWNGQGENQLFFTVGDRF